MSNGSLGAVVRPLGGRVWAVCGVVGASWGPLGASWQPSWGLLATSCGHTDVRPAARRREGAAWGRQGASDRVKRERGARKR
eukprot:9495065-Pyramimonas_sp.AAC.1